MTGWAIKTGLTFGDGTTTGGVSLDRIADADMQTFAATFASGPSGLDYMVAYPVLDLGTDGRITIIAPTLNTTTKMTRVPKLTGPLAGAHYDMIASAIDDPTKPLPATLTWLRNVNPSATVAVSSWMSPPSALAMTGGVFSFTPVTGATRPRRRAADDGRPAALVDHDLRRHDVVHAAGPVAGSAAARHGPVLGLGAAIPGFDLKNVVFDDLADVSTDISQPTRSPTRAEAEATRASGSSSATPLVQPKPISLLV